jgi:hypothetical protein
VVWGVGEHKGVVIECGAEFGAAALRTLLMRGQARDRVVVELDDPHLVSFGVLENRLAIAPDQAAPDGQQAGDQVEVLPRESDQLAAPRTGDERQPDKGASLGILLPCGVRDLGRFLRRGRIPAAASACVVAGRRPTG